MHIYRLESNELNFLYKTARISIRSAPQKRFYRIKNNFCDIFGQSDRQKVLGILGRTITPYVQRNYTIKDCTLTPRRAEQISEFFWRYILDKARMDQPNEVANLGNMTIDKASLYFQALYGTDCDLDTMVSHLNEACFNSESEKLSFITLLQSSENNKKLILLQLASAKCEDIFRGLVESYQIVARIRAHKLFDARFTKEQKTEIKNKFAFIYCLLEEIKMLNETAYFNFNHAFDNDRVCTDFDFYCKITQNIKAPSKKFIENFTKIFAQEYSLTSLIYLWIISQNLKGSPHLLKALIKALANRTSGNLEDILSKLTIWVQAKYTLLEALKQNLEKVDAIIEGLALVEELKETIDSTQLIDQIIWNPLIIEVIKASAISEFQKNLKDLTISLYGSPAFQQCITTLDTITDVRVFIHTVQALSKWHFHYNLQNFKDRPELLKWVILSVAQFANTNLKLSFTKKIISHLVLHIDWILSKQSKPEITFVQAFMEATCCMEESMLDNFKESLSSIPPAELSNTLNVINRWGQICKIKDPAILSFLVKTISRGPFYHIPKCDHLSPIIELIAFYQENHPSCQLERLFQAIDEIPGILLHYIIHKCKNAQNSIISIYENLYIHLEKIPIEQWSNVLQIACHFSAFYSDNVSQKKELIEQIYNNPSLYIHVWIRSERICPWIYESSMRSLAAFLKCKLRNRLPNEKKVIEQLITHQLPFFLEYFPPGIDENDKFYPLCITGSMEEKPTLSLLYSQIRQNPLKVIRFIGPAINKCHSFFIKYYGQEGYDEGGLSRDFFSSLFREFKNTHYMLVDIPIYNLHTPKNKQRRLFHYIGRILDFLVRNNHQYPIGKIFHENFFAALLYFSWEELQSSFKKLKLSLIRKLELISYIDTKFCYTKEAIKILKLDPNNILTPEDRNDINSILEALGYQITEYYNNDGQLDIKMIKETITQVFATAIECLENNIRVIFWIAQGLFYKKPAHYDNLKSLGAKAFEIRVQGYFSAELLKSALSFDNVPKTIRQTIIDWIDNKEKIPQKDQEEALKRFLIMVTGAPTVPYDRKIIFYRNSKTKEIAVSACHYIISLPNENASRAWNKFLQLLALPSFYDIVGFGRA